MRALKRSRIAVPLISIVAAFAFSAQAQEQQHKPPPQGQARPAAPAARPAQERRERVQRMLQKVGLETAGKIQLRKYSKGMLQRVGLAQGLLQAALYEAEEKTKDELDQTMREFRQQGYTPQQAHDRAWEMVREEYILLPPET